MLVAKNHSFLWGHRIPQTGRNRFRSTCSILQRPSLWSCGVYITAQDNPRFAFRLQQDARSCVSIRDRTVADSPTSITCCCPCRLAARIAYTPARCWRDAVLVNGPSNTYEPIKTISTRFARHVLWIAPCKPESRFLAKPAFLFSFS